MLPAEDLRKALSAPIAEMEKTRAMTHAMAIEDPWDRVVIMLILFSFFIGGIIFGSRTFAGISVFIAVVAVLSSGDPRNFFKRRKRDLTTDEYRRYRAIWVEKLLAPFLKLQDTHIQASSGSIFLIKQQKAAIYLPYTNYGFKDYAGGFTVNMPQISINVDFLMLRHSEQGAEIFNGIVCKIPFRQLIATGFLQIIYSPDHLRNNAPVSGAKKIAPSLILPNQSAKGLMAFSNDELHTEDIANTGWGALFKKYMGFDTPFLCLTAHKHYIYLSINLNSYPCQPSLDGDVFRDIDLALWNKIFELVNDCAAIAEQRRDLLSPHQD